MNTLAPLKLNISAQLLNNKQVVNVHSKHEVQQKLSYHYEHKWNDLCTPNNPVYLIHLKLQTIQQLSEQYCKNYHHGCHYYFEV